MALVPKLINKKSCLKYKTVTTRSYYTTTCRNFPTNTVWL